MVRKQADIAICNLLAWFLAAMLLAACQSPPATTEAPPTIEPQAAGKVFSTLPENIDPGARYVFYIHGKIIETEGPQAVSPEFGAYEFEQILSDLAGAGFQVIGEVRSGPTFADEYANRVAEQVNALIEAGVPAEDITIVGFSKGAWITLVTSVKLANPDLNFVLIAICGEELDQTPDLLITGRALSLYERSDEYGASCQSLADRSPGVTQFEEIEFNTGKRHGAFYTADPLWLDPVIRWIEGVGE